VQAPVDGDLGEIESDDLVVGPQRLFVELVEDPSGDPLVAACPQCRVGHRGAVQALCVLPRAACRQSDDDGVEALPVGDPRAVTTERVAFDGDGDERLDGGPHGISHFGFERAHDGRDPPFRSFGVFDRNPIVSGLHRRPVDGHP
jgi:hypothetical protein